MNRSAPTTTVRPATYNAVLIPVAAGALYPVNGTLLSPIFAAASMALSSVFVLGNALRLKRFRAPMTVETRTEEPASGAAWAKLCPADER